MFSFMKQQKSVIRVTALILISITIINFFNISVYGADTFSDVKPSDYYYEAVQEMADNKYVFGYGDSTFRPKNNITMAESLTVLFRIAGYEVPTMEFPEYWYSSVWNEGKRLGLVYETDNPNDYATRLDIAKFIVRLYNIDISLTNVQNVFKDTNLLVANTMYQHGIFVGSPVDDGVVFLPDSPITRGDLSLVIYRLNDKISSPYIGTITFGQYEVNVNPDTLEDYMLILRALGECGELSISVPYTKDLSNISYYLKVRESAVEAFERCFSLYPEYFSFTPTLTLKREIHSYNSGFIVLTLSNESIPNEEVERMRDEFDLTCETIIAELYAYGVIDSTTPTIDKVRLLYEYVALHCEYDTSYGVNSFTGYGAAVEGKAVCQGYTAMLNKLCQIIGLTTKGISGVIVDTSEPHMWSAIYDTETTKWIYCDVTFGDPILGGSDNKDYFDLAYFDIAEEELMVGRIKDWE